MDIGKTYPHLCLTDWPFRIVPEGSFCTFLADRKQLGEDIDALLRHLSRRDTSTIHAVWSWYGAGKTHTLRYIENLCKSGGGALIPVYTEFPKGGRSFLDLFQSALLEIDSDLLLSSYEEVVTNPRKSEIQRQLGKSFPDLVTALNILLMGSQQQQNTARLWLRAENLTMKDIRGIGLSTRIDSEERAIQTMASIMLILSRSMESAERLPARVIWMIDEFQRLEDFPGRPAKEVNGCLHSLFNRSPRSFSMVLSFSGPPSSGLPPWMSRELADRMGGEKVMILPPLTPSEAEVFVKDILAHFRPKNTPAPSPEFPFGAGAIHGAVQKLHKKVKDLRPRIIMQAFSYILEAAEPSMQSGSLKEINEEFAINIVSERDFQNPEETKSTRPRR